MVNGLRREGAIIGRNEGTTEEPRLAASLLFRVASRILPLATASRNASHDHLLRALQVCIVRSVEPIQDETGHEQATTDRA
jgi:hypothetical protein